MANILLLAVTLSIDSLAIGITYGIRNILVPFRSKLILFSVSFIIILLSVLFGATLMQFMPQWLSHLTRQHAFILHGNLDYLSEF